MNVEKLEKPLAWGCGIFVAIFGAVFLCVGLMAFLGYTSIRDPQGKPSNLVGGSVFALAGGLIIGLGIWLTFTSLAQKKLNTQFPNESWRRRKDWSQGIVASGSKSMAIGITAFAAFWNVLGTVGPIYMLVNEPFRPGNLIALIFPLIGLLMAWYALVLWRRYLYWGESILQLEQFPPRLGTLLKGQIKLNRMINGSTPVSLKLMCESVTVTGTGKSRSTRRNTLWDAQTNLDGSAITIIPVSFVIPANMPAFYTTAQNSIEWNLKIKAQLPGPDYDASFALPVIEADPNQPPVEASAIQQAPDRRSLEQRVNDPAIRITPRIGSLHLVFPAFRHRIATLPILIILAIAATGSTLCYFAGGPWIITIVIGLITLLLFYWLLSMIFPRSEITVARSGIEGTVRNIIGTRLINIPRTDISAINAPSRMTSGETHYCDLVVRTNDLKKIPIARMIRDKSAATAIKDEIEKVLGL